MASMKNGASSTILSVLGIILFTMSYFISTNPTFTEKITIGTLFFTGIASMIASIVFGILGIKSKEKGFLKYTGMLILLLISIGLLLVPIFIGIFGFNEP
jgi:hypothetical protein